jgi:lysophospholipase L1-like esterase
MKDKNGALNKLYTNDGLHLTGEGYMVWKNELINKRYCCQL